ncbi:cation transport ATPase [Oceanimonas sp. GK1]|uniref:cation-translocating P-type ATPase n=1 Tax=Oceanimonas sp. (strain GK1 / IBRC-M 10197) TaxID=511062 RepID=UPI0002495628|nr:cation-translocating P-type ATPase [Oceanimonas sp. GK1]AEY01134.1 cation transport ATPase [Oceanimonas sp. GK1]
MTVNTPRWHRLSTAQAVTELDSDRHQGLSQSLAAQRLAEQGENRLDEAIPRAPWLKFLDQFKGFLVLVLLFAAALAWVIGELKDAVVILLVVLFNAVLGFHQEHRAERTLAALKGMLVPKARVRRNGLVQEIATAELVPGDLVLLEAGDQVPADGRVLAAHALEAQEAALTGESQPIGKFAEPLEQDELPLGERGNMLYMNTTVTRGRGEMLVVATGMRTEMGGIASLIAQAPEGETPLQQQLDRLGKRLAAIAGVVVAVIFAMTLMRGTPWADAAMTSVALAVAAVPEGLPAVVTVTLAIGMWRMARKKAILKKLAAVETLGATTVICTDKTGTLTLNQMTARAGWYAGHRFTVTGQGYRPEGEIQVPHGPPPAPMLPPMALCTESRVRDGQLIGDPTEGALYVLAQKGGLDPSREQVHAPRLAEIPFDSAHKFMATFHHRADKVVMYIKGAPDVLLGHASRWRQAKGPRPLSEAVASTIMQENDHLAGQALRVLAVAEREIPARDFDPDADLWCWVGDWTFLGMVGLMDPPRPEAAEAIALCQGAGIQVKMITGDHKTTAAAIARELGLTGAVLSGAELDGMSDAELARRIDDVTVFARVSPQHKVKIVRALQADGHITAMTGDGVNDAPALKAADIGVAMGLTGTAVTQEAATLVLTDDNFSTIVQAIEEGRTIYDNIVKFVRFQLSTNIAAMFTVLAATLLSLPVPFTAIQLLWINIIMDGPPAMTLGVEPARAGLMGEPPRAPGTLILSGRRLGKLLLYGITMMVGTLTMLSHGLSLDSPGLAGTLAFTTFVLYQFFNVFNARAEQGSAFNRHFLSNGKLWLALASVLILQWLVVHWPPLQQVFGTVALTGVQWLLCALVASSVLLLDEIAKLGLRVWSRAVRR